MSLGLPSHKARAHYHIPEDSFLTASPSGRCGCVSVCPKSGIALLNIWPHSVCTERTARAAETEGAGAVVFPWFHWSQLSQGFTERRKTSWFLQHSQWWHRIRANIWVGTCQTMTHGPGYQTADRIAVIIIWRGSAWRYQSVQFGCVSPCFASPPTHKNLMIYLLTCPNHTVPIVPKSQSLAHRVDSTKYGWFSPQPFIPPV